MGQAERIGEMDPPPPLTPMFEIDGYQLAMALVGVGIILAYWLPRFVSERQPASSSLLILSGLVFLPLVPGIPEALDPREEGRLWELASELAVIIALFGTGLRIDVVDYARWRPTVRLLAILMPLTIAAVALIGWGLAGLTLGAALLLGAVLAPTDPVLAGDVQVGPPTEGGEHPVRFSLTTEAGLNDGLAFPFVYFALIAAVEGFAPQSWGAEWLLRDVLYRVAVGAIAGAAIGWLLGKLLFDWPGDNPLAETGSGVAALAGVLLAYAGTELIEGYGFIAAFACGLTLRRVESGHDYHSDLHTFNEVIEHALTALLLLLLGGILPLLWPFLGWTEMAIGAALIFIIRPLAAWGSLLGSGLQGRERAVVSFYGVRGIGSIYYLAYGLEQVELAEAGRLWAIVAFAILLSTVIHGLTAGAAVAWAKGHGDEERSQNEAEPSDENAATGKS